MPRKHVSLLAFAFVVLISCSVRATQDKAQPEETWDAVFMGEDKVGYVHTVTQNLKEQGKNVVHVQVETVMSIKRFGQSTEMRLDYNSYETPEGKVLRMDNKGLDTRVRGEVQGKMMKLTLETPGKQNTINIAWGDDVLGPGAENRILKKQPLKAGQQRSFRSFMPDLNQVITNTLTGEEMEEVSLLDGTKQKLQRVRVEIDGIPALKNMKTFSWIDPKGEALKTHTNMLAGMTTYRVSKEVAVAAPNSVSADFGMKTLIKTDKKIPKAYDTTELVYRIELKEEDPKQVFPEDERQSLSKGENNEWLLTIRAIDPTVPGKELAKDGLAEFLRPNNWLQSDDAKVIQAAKDAVGDATDPWQKARRIEKWVYQNVTEKNFSKVFDSAAVVAEKLEGDCTEHGVLLAAMARVEGIPSRVAMGLVYAERLSAFGYHMWAEVYLNGHWVPLEGTLGRGHASPAHIKLADSSLDGVDYQVTFLPVAQVMDKLKIEVVSWKHAEAN